MAANLSWRTTHPVLFGKRKSVVSAATARSNGSIALIASAAGPAPLTNTGVEAPPAGWKGNRDSKSSIRGDK